MSAENTSPEAECSTTSTSSGSCVFGIPVGVKEFIKKYRDVSTGVSPAKISKISYDESNVLKSNVAKHSTIRHKEAECSTTTCRGCSTIRHKEAECSSTSTVCSSSFFGLPVGVKALIKKYKGVSELYGWQGQFLHFKTLEGVRNVVCTFPTRGGKTLVAEILILRELLYVRKNALFILPYDSTVHEKVNSLSQFALDLGVLVEEYGAQEGCYPPRKDRNKQTAYIATIEKAHCLINSLIENNRLSEIGLVVVDKLDILGVPRSGATLECLLTKLLFCSDAVHILGMSATAGNLVELADFLKADLYSHNSYPLELKEYIKYKETLWAINVGEGEILSAARKIEHQQNPVVRVKYNNVCALVLEVLPKHSCLVFCSTKEDCESVVLKIVRAMPSSLIETRKAERKALLSALRSLGKGKICPVLEKCVPYGVVYHHAGLMGEERKLIEEAYCTEVLFCICCTLTSAAGVNLPTKRVILHSPYVDGWFITLTQYQQMVNFTDRTNLTGESIIVCKTRQEVEIVEKMLCSAPNIVDSTLDKPDDRAVQSLILSAIGLGIANTRRELHALFSHSLLHSQSKRTKVNCRAVVDLAVKKLFSAKFLYIPKRQKSCSENCTCEITHHEKRPVFPIGQKSKVRPVALDTVLKLRRLGTACKEGSIEVNIAPQLYKNLCAAKDQFARSSVSLLHMLYIVTPPSLVDRAKVIPAAYLQSYTELCDSDKNTAEALGITKHCVMLHVSGQQSDKIPARVFRTFYLTLMLHDMWKNDCVCIGAQKYSESRRFVQTLITSTSSFASCVLRFCEQISEFGSFEPLLSPLVEHLCKLQSYFD